eukprot:COSAG02_NODE_193_length_29843_cov_30.519903_30_plen_92_part_00
MRWVLYLHDGAFKPASGAVGGSRARSLAATARRAPGGRPHAFLKPWVMNRDNQAGIRHTSKAISRSQLTFYCMESRNQCNFVCSCLRAMRK